MAAMWPYGVSNGGANSPPPAAVAAAAAASVSSTPKYTSQWDGVPALLFGLLRPEAGGRRALDLSQVVAPELGAHVLETPAENLVVEGFHRVDIRNGQVGPARHTGRPWLGADGHGFILARSSSR